MIILSNMCSTKTCLLFTLFYFERYVYAAFPSVCLLRACTVDKVKTFCRICALPDWPEFGSYTTWPGFGLVAKIQCKNVRNHFLIGCYVEGIWKTWIFHNYLALSRKRYGSHNSGRWMCDLSIQMTLSEFNWAATISSKCS